MTREDILRLWQPVRRYVLNKYTIVCVVALLILCFLGDQSLLECTKRSFVVREKRVALERRRAEIQATRQQIDELKASPANLERYAREHYHMHTDDEDVYLIND